MTFRIDRTRVAVSARSAPGAEDCRREAKPATQALVPLPVEPVRSPLHHDRRRDSGAAFEAQLMGQDGQKRGLRAGQPLFDQARGAYCRAEWSGTYDRRRRTGRQARISA